MSGFAAAQAAAFDAAGRAQQRQLWQGMGAYERHKRMMHDLATVYGGRGGGGAAEAQQQGPAKSDWEVLREQHRFIRSEADDASDSWEVREGDSDVGRAAEQLLLRELHQFILSAADDANACQLVPRLDTLSIR